MARQTFLSDPSPQTTVQSPIQDTSIADLITGVTPAIVEGARAFQTNALNEEVSVAKGQQVAGIAEIEGLKAQRSLATSQQLSAGIPEREVVDSPEIQAFTARIDKIRAGKVSGKLTTAGFDARVNDLVKQASVRAPAFASDFRKIGGTTKGGAGSASGFFGSFEQTEKEELAARERESISVQKFKGGQAIYATDPLLRRMTLREMSNQEAYNKRSNIDTGTYLDEGFGGTTGRVTNLIHSFTNEAGAIENVGLASFTINKHINDEIAKVERGNVGGENVTTDFSQEDIKSLVTQLEQLRERTISTIESGDFAEILASTKTMVKDSMFLTEANMYPTMVTLQSVYGMNPKTSIEAAAIIANTPEALRPVLDSLSGGASTFMTKRLLDASTGSSETGFETFVRNMYARSTPNGDKVAKYISQGLTHRVGTLEPADKETVDVAAQIQVDQYEGAIEDNSFYRESPKSWNHFTDQPGAIEKWNNITPDIVVQPFTTMPEGFTLVSDLKNETVAILDSEGKLVISVGPKIEFSLFGGNRTLRRGSEEFLSAFDRSVVSRERIPLDPVHAFQTLSPVPRRDLEALRDTMLLQESSRHKTPKNIQDSGMFGTDLITLINSRELTGVVSTEVVADQEEPLALSPEQQLVERVTDLRTTFPDATDQEIMKFITSMDN